jgi:hypothetical protein
MLAEWRTGTFARTELALLLAVIPVPGLAHERKSPRGKGESARAKKFLAQKVTNLVPLLCWNHRGQNWLAGDDTGHAPQGFWLVL